MDVFPKFIIETDHIEGDCLIVALCTHHKQLVTDPTKVKGGGWWLREDSNVVTFHRKSEDFGPAEFENIKACILNKKVFSSSSLLKNISDTYDFKYRNVYGEIININ